MENYDKLPNSFDSFDYLLPGLSEYNSVNDIFELNATSDGYTTPSFFEEALIASTGKTIKQLIENGNLLSGDGVPYEMSDFSEKDIQGFENFVVPEKLVNDLQNNGPLYIWRDDVDSPTPFAINYVKPDFLSLTDLEPENAFDLEEMRDRIGTNAYLDYSSIEISRKPINKSTNIVSTPRPSLGSRIAHWFRRGMNSLFGTELKDPDNVSRYYDEQAKQEKLDKIVSTFGRERNIDLERYKPAASNITKQNAHIDTVKAIRRMRKEGKDQSEMTQALADKTADRQAFFGNLTDSEIKQTANDISKAKKNITSLEAISKDACSSVDILKDKNYSVDSSEAQKGLAVLFVKALNDSMEIKGEESMSAQKFTSCVDALTATDAFQKYLKHEYKPEIGQKMAEGKDHALPFGELNKISKLANTLKGEERKAFGKVMDDIGRAEDNSGLINEEDRFNLSMV